MASDWTVSEHVDRVTYAEGDRALDFPRVPSERRPVVLVPDAGTWDRVLPAWLHGRRDEVVARLTSGVLTFEETDAQDWVAERERLV